MTENLFCAGTYKNILQCIAKPALEGAQIRLSTKVTSVESAHNNVAVGTEDGNIFKFDEVVMTNPLGWLQKNEKIFNPVLPARFSQATNAIGYGSLEKVCILKYVPVRCNH